MAGNGTTIETTADSPEYRPYPGQAFPRGTAVRGTAYQPPPGFTASTAPVGCAFAVCSTPRNPFPR